MIDIPMFLLYTLLLISPFILTGWLVYRFKAGWKVFWIGILVGILAGIFYLATIYGLSISGINIWQHSPPTTWITFSITAGLVSALATESIRWVGFRWAKASGGSYVSSLVLGSGSGSVGMIVTIFSSFLISALLALIACSGISNGGPIQLPFINYSLQIACTNPQQSAQFVAPAIFNFLVSNLTFILEILAPLSIHIAASVMVWTAIRKGKIMWFLTALLWHAFIKGAYVYITGLAYFPGSVEKPTLPTYIISLGTGIMIALNILFIVWNHKHALTVEQANKVSLPDETTGETSSLENSI